MRKIVVDLILQWVALVVIVIHCKLLPEISKKIIFSFLLVSYQTLSLITWIGVGRGKPLKVVDATVVYAPISYSDLVVEAIILCQATRRRWLGRHIIAIDSIYTSYISHSPTSSLRIIWSAWKLLFSNENLKKKLFPTWSLSRESHVPPQIVEL